MNELLLTLEGLGRPVAYHPGFAKMLGSVKAGLLLDQLLYWWPRRRDEKGVYKTADEWTEETGLSRREQESARKKLREVGILIEDYDRLNHRMYFTIEEDELQRVWTDFVHSRFDKSAIRESTKGEVGIRQKRHSSSTEITTENTTEITTSRAVARVAEPRQPPALRDDLQRYIDDQMRAVQPYENYARERGQIKTLAARCRRRDPEHPEHVADAMLAAFRALRDGGDDWWSRQPYTPSVLSSLWERIEAAGGKIAEEMQREREWKAWVAQG